VRISGRVANPYATLRISLVVHSGDASVRNEFPGLHCFYVHAFLQTRCMPTTVVFLQSVHRLRDRTPAASAHDLDIF
jgi:hypothetical protein